ncbi:hypothetical protein ACFQ5X_48540 [Streptomyces kaempferi]|uniref:Transposase n=1 Tax=Streptomyces kaempferi TaxID=333725 RepID=A0ABW3XVK6_9ACTN
MRRGGINVVENNHPDRATRRKRGKTDAVDADAAARAVLSGRTTTVPKTADSPTADMRVLRLTKESAVKAPQPSAEPAQGRPAGHPSHGYAWITQTTGVVSGGLCRSPSCTTRRTQGQPWPPSARHRDTATPQHRNTATPTD